MSARKLFRYFRILVLLALLFGVAMSTWLTRLRSTDWDQPLWIALYPINGDQNRDTAGYIKQLDMDHFHTIADFINEEAEFYKLPLRDPFTLRLMPEVHSLPPAPPVDRNMLSVMWWSLKLRYWAWSEDSNTGPTPDIRMFVVYYDPQQHQRLAHSLGLQKGMLGVVNGFSGRSYNLRNNVIIAHEILHTLGATDKYNLATGQPNYPAGYARPEQHPLYPQELGEIMAAYIPISEARQRMPRNLHETVIGEKTAGEINWIK